jgi:hypothetical protein
MVHSSPSVTERAQGASPHAPPDRRGPLVGLPSDLVWRQDLFRLGPVRFCVRVGQCVCVACAQGVFDEMLERAWPRCVRHHGVGALPQHTARPWRGRGMVAVG